MQTAIPIKNMETNIAMFYEKNRLETFKNWPFDDNKACNAAKMAEAGFYSVADSTLHDWVRCFLCKKNLDGWKENDNPWLEHVTHSKNCTFAKIGKPEKSLTVDQLIEMKKSTLQSEVDSCVKQLKDFKDKEVKKKMANIKGLMLKKR